MININTVKDALTEQGCRCCAKRMNAEGKSLIGVAEHDNGQWLKIKSQSAGFEEKNVRTAEI